MNCRRRMLSNCHWSYWFSLSENELWNRSENRTPRCASPLPKAMSRNEKRTVRMWLQIDLKTSKINWEAEGFFAFGLLFYPSNLAGLFEKVCNANFYSAQCALFKGKFSWENEFLSQKLVSVWWIARSRRLAETGSEICQNPLFKRKQSVYIQTLARIIPIWTEN